MILIALLASVLLESPSPKPSVNVSPANLIGKTIHRSTRRESKTSDGYSEDAFADTVSEVITVAREGDGFSISHRPDTIDPSKLTDMFGAMEAISFKYKADFHFKALFLENEDTYWDNLKEITGAPISATVEIRKKITAADLLNMLSQHDEVALPDLGELTVGSTVQRQEKLSEHHLIYIPVTASYTLERMENGTSRIHRRAIATAEEVRIVEINHAQDIMRSSGVSIEDQKTLMERVRSKPIDPGAAWIEDCTLIIDNLAGIPTEITCDVSTGPFGPYKGSYSIQQKVQ